jgi:hypothetical protein
MRDGRSLARPVGRRRAGADTALVEVGIATIGAILLHSFLIFDAFVP